ncbi:MAG: dephospho-CoA kinase [Desulfovibrionales bacterium]|nr:dephospho-CoA kinase [Desulfovibrionales bacterium]
MQELVEKVAVTDGGERLDVFWQSCLDEEGVTRTRVQDWIRKGRASVNGCVCTKPSTRIVPGQILALKPEFPASAIIPEPGPLLVLHADEHVLVLDKEPGMTVHPAPSVCAGTLVHRAASHFPVLLGQEGQRPGVVHRLDKDTSGLIVLALSDSSRLALSRAFASRHVYKEYLALVAGAPRSAGSITVPLGRHPLLKTRMAAVSRGGRPAETRYRVLWTAPDQSASLLRIRILTGRTHQIRVHMAELGHPLLGDAVYADKDTASRAPRQMLHAWQLRFTHPVSEQEMAFCCPPPDDFMRVLGELCRPRLCIGLTGAAGSGKSAVLDLVQACGLPVFCADQVVARAYARGGEGAAVLKCHFGSRFLAPDGGVDKAVLLSAMSSSESLRREVERLVHPLVRRALAEFKNAHADDVLLAEIPLLCEAELSSSLDLVAVIFCPDGLRQERLLKRGWDLGRINQVDSWQWPQEAKVRMAHLILDNSGSLSDLQARTAAMIRVSLGLIARRAERQMKALKAIFEHPDTNQDTESSHVSPA